MIHVCWSQVKTPISRFLLDDLEEDAKKMADSIQLMMTGLKLKLHAVRSDDSILIF